MTTTSLIRATTRAALFSTTALVATASGAHAFTYTVSGSQNSTFDLDAGDSLIIDSSGAIVNVSPGVTVGGASGSILVETGGDITSVDVGIELQGLTSDLTGGIIVESTATITGVTTGAGILGTGILVHTGADISGGLDNSGTISGGANGILVTDGASLSGASTNSGSIYGAAAAIALGDGATEANTIGALTNTGEIGLNAAADGVSAKGILVNGSGSDITGLITNSTGGVIVGAATAIHVNNDGIISGGITNAGVIGQAVTTGGTATALIAIKVEGSGDISGTITNSGTILAANTAVLVSSAAISGGIVNSGAITGGTGAGEAAIKLNAGTLGSTANVGLNNSGTISGDAAIDINAGSTVYGITNSGAIFSTAADAAIDLDASQVEGDITNSGRIGANVGATVLNDVGIDFYDTDSSGGIINTGIIAGTDIAISLDSGSDLSGAITNNTGGTIGTFTGATAAQQATTGILVFRGSSVAGGIDNTGTILGTTKGIYLGEDSTLGATATAGIVNNALGLISGGATGIDIDKSTVLGGISNTGTIVGGNVGIALSNNDSAGSATIVASLTNVLGGDIAGANTAIAVLSGSQITGVLSNAGTIGNATAGAGIASYGVVVDGASSDIVGGINNTNIIKGSLAAIEVADNADITGGITNSGQIFGSAAAIHVITGGKINGITNTSTGIIGRNAGATVAATTAILVDGTTTASDINGTITNAGIIEGTINAISLIGSGDITGGISNSSGGLIQGLAGDAISVAAGSTIGTTAGTGISNAAATASKGILGALNGIDIAGSVEGGISNTGTIAGAGGEAILVTGTGGSVTGGISNNAGGAMTGTANGISIMLGASVDAISNSGTITGTNNDGINIGIGSVVGPTTGPGFGISNAAGTATGGILGNVNGIDIAGSVLGGISNTGYINGAGGEAILVTGTGGSVVGGISNGVGGKMTGSANGISVASDGTVDSISNSGAIVGTANSGINISVANGVTGIITNNATSTISGSTAGISVSGTGSVDGGIVNAGTIIGQNGAGTLGTGILIATNAIVSTVTNSGTITGGTAGLAVQFGLADSTLTLQTGSTLNGDADGGTGTNDTLVLEGYGTEDSVFTDFESLTVSASTSGTWVLSGASSIDAVTLNSGTLDIQGAFTATSVSVAGGVLNVSSTGVLTAPTIAATGDLDVEGTIVATGGVTVDGTVSGSGTISGALTVNGILSPGNSPGQISVATLNQTSGSTYLVEHDINSISGFLTDTTDVTGTATIGTDVDIDLVVGAGTDGFVDDILTAGNIVGEYDDINADDNLAALVVYDGGLTTATLLVAKTDALAASAATVSDAGFVFLDNMQEGARRDGRVWATGYIYNAENEGLGQNGADFDQDAFGFNAGVDVISEPDLKVGLAVGYLDGDIDIDSSTSEAENDGIFGAAYLNYMNDNFYLDGAVMIGQQTVDTTRTLTASTATASVDATSYGANLEAGFELEALGGRLSPFVKVGIHSASLDSYSEAATADTGAMTVGEVETQQMRVGGGFRYAVDLGSADGIQVTPAIKVGMTQEWHDGDSSADIGFVGYTGSTTASLDFEDQTTIDLGLSFDVKLSEAVSAFVGWDAALGDETTRNTGTIGLSVNW